jgi:hypothetical protein
MLHVQYDKIFKAGKSSCRHTVFREHTLPCTSCWRSSVFFIGSTFSLVVVFNSNYGTVHTHAFSREVRFPCLLTPRKDWERTTTIVFCLFSSGNLLLNFPQKYHRPKRRLKHRGLIKQHPIVQWTRILLKVVVGFDLFVLKVFFCTVQYSTYSPPATQLKIIWRTLTPRLRPSCPSDAGLAPFC